MKLPVDTRLALQAHYAPGDSTPSKPKQAMVVRMSTESLDALAATPSGLQFQFGDTPGFHIGESFYSMRPLKEDVPHELYLRAASSNKPNAPLKLCATVSGKFTVQRDLGATNIEDRLRESTIEANEAKSKRTIQILDSPLDLRSSTTSKKKKPTVGASSLRKSLANSRSSVPERLAPATGSQLPSRGPSPLLAKPSTSTSTSTSTSAPINHSLRNRIIHCLALKERTCQDVIKMVNDSSQNVNVILTEVAEESPSSKKNDILARTWRLKPSSWMEVRPYEWPRLIQADRMSMARSAMLVLSKLKIPESNDLWNHMRPRASHDTPPSLDAAPRRGISSKEIRDKKTRPKTDSKEISIKVESGTLPGSPPGASSRRTPGSGYKLTKSISRESQSNSNLPTPSQADHSSRATKQSHIIPSLASSSAKREPDASSSSQPQRFKKIKREPGEASDRELDQKEKGESKEQLRPRMSESASTATKRKDLHHGDLEDVQEYPVKRSRTSEPSRPAPNLALPKRPDVPMPNIPAILKTEAVPMSRPINDRSPLPPATVKVEPSPTPPTDSKPQRHRRRREDAYYTSSDDEDDNTSSPPKRIANHNEPLQRPKISKRLTPLPSEHSALRSRYDVGYIKYLSLYSKLLGQKNTIEGMLNSEDASDYSEDGEGLMVYEDFASLTKDFNICYDELMQIRSKFEPGSSRSEDYSD